MDLGPVKHLGWSIFAKIVNNFKANFQLTNLLKYSFLNLYFLTFLYVSCLLKVCSGVHFTWFPGVKSQMIILRIFSCIMKLQQYSSELRANTKCIPRAFCFSNLTSRFNFTAIFQIIMAKYNQNMVDKIQNFKHAGKDSFNLGVKSLTHYKFINSYSLN